jgi:hypothetical protein
MRREIDEDRLVAAAKARLFHARTALRRAPQIKAICESDAMSAR